MIDDKLDDIITRYQDVLDILFNQVLESDCNKDRVKLLSTVSNSYSRLLQDNVNSKKIKELSDKLDSLLDGAL